MRFHVVGIGGAGMSAIARLLVAGGHELSGSDRGHWPLSDALARDGVVVHDEFSDAHVQGADVVLRSSAYRDDNVEVRAALRRSLPVWKREDAWRLLAKDRRVIAVAGTHGKTTTTALAWTALRGGGIDASLLCGGVVRDIGTNAHAGSSDFLVIEADEYERAFHALRPLVAVVTNVDHDHVDVFPTRADVDEAFRVFVGNLDAGGVLVACADDAGARGLARASPTATTYGTAPDAAYVIGEREAAPDRQSFALTRPGGDAVSVLIQLPGVHNARNAAAALAVADRLGVLGAGALDALASFSGTERRLETLGTARGVLVVDDYAHHPAEIRASIAAMRGRGGRLVAVFQPHTPSRLAAFFDDFASALGEADVVVVAETFASARESSRDRGAARALASRARATYAPDAEDAARALAPVVRSGDVVLVLGAGDIRRAGERLLELLRQPAPA